MTEPAPKKKRIRTPLVREPEPGLWSNCIVVGDQFFIAGMVARDPQGKLVGSGDPYAQSMQALRNFKAYVEACGATMDDVVRITINLTDIRFRPALIEARRQFFRDDFPTAVLVGDVTLASPELLVEIDGHGIIGCGKA
ncbi:MAG: RidA family protein [Alphaproteobacteria bacterium]|nr:RidA family protein [Alphaproteobacteria bacterium]